MGTNSFEDVYNTFFAPGEVTEIRAYGLSRKGPWEGYAAGAGVVSGYFDNAKDFAAAAVALEEAKAPGIYFTLNPVDEDLIARAKNRLKAAGPKTSLTTDKDITCIRWLPIDLDPVRKSGISSTDEELAYAFETAGRIHPWFTKYFGFPGPVKGISGNGAHLCYRLPDLTPVERGSEIVKKILVLIARKFDTDQVKIDRAVFNPSRIWKVYGTTARKGDHTEKRPHRKSKLISKSEKEEVSS
ncbi:MAG: hypothetical protein C4530_11430 [Desulfobacteraceae bacterium]|nr:MAG: hypothetical protein C4530_11430 [Desulfobacteraceae bacterium]